MHQSSDQSNSGRKEIEKSPSGEETEGQELQSRRDHQSSGQPLIQPYREEKYKEKNPRYDSNIPSRDKYTICTIAQN